MIQIIEQIVCAARNVSYINIHSKSRKMEFKEARQLVMFFTKEMYPKMRLSDISGYYKLDHSTCIHAIKTINNLIETNPDFNEEIEYIRIEIQVSLSDRIVDRLKLERNSILRIIDKYQIKLDGLNDIITRLEEVEIKIAAPVKIEVPVKAEFLPVSDPLLNDFKSPYEKLESVNNRGYSGYRNHSL